MTPAQSSKLWSGAKVADVKLVSGTDLGRSRNRQIEHSHNGRCQSRSERESADESGVHPTSRANGRGGVGECRIYPDER